MNYMELVKTMIPSPEDFRKNLVTWIQSNAKFWGVSVGVHAAILLVLGVAIGAPQAKKMLEEVVFFDSEVDTASQEDTPISQFDVGETPIDPTVLNTDSLTAVPAASIEQEARNYDDSPVFDEAGAGSPTGTSSFGGLTTLNVVGLGDGPMQPGGNGFERGEGEPGKPGGGGNGPNFGTRNSGSREKSLARDGGTAESERCVSAALNWLARHQNIDGSWGCVSFHKNCKDPTCKAHLDENASEEYQMAATAFGLLPFFAAGQTHNINGPYVGTIKRGVDWMARAQDKKTGRLGGGNMYEHGLATIAICEAYGLSKDRNLMLPAQMAIKFIEDAQNDTSGGWHYSANPPTVGDTSVVGWQLMGLKSGQMAGLQVNPATMVKAQKFLKSVSKGKAGGLFSYMPESPPSPTMSAVGLLCNQYMGMKRDDPAMVEGLAHVMGNLNTAEHNAYFLYYATQVMHNVPGPDWDRWNRHARRFLIGNQIKTGCAAGSWPTANKGHAAGPIMITSISALTLEVYYRYLPLYQLEEKGSRDKDGALKNMPKE